ncbi:hypothetical protein J6590_040140 [Homalodisca vitripennis]|nr:hypothetical protein J6590_040140 [Homalodisca vitripennis]
MIQMQGVFEERVERPLQGGGDRWADDKMAGSSPFHAHHGRAVSLCQSVCHGPWLRQKASVQTHRVIDLLQFTFA